MTLMLGRQDIVVQTHGLGRLPALDICARAILLHWRGAVFQSGATAQVYVGYGAIPWGREHEIFVYRDRDALDNWEEFEAHAGNANTMIYLLAYDETQVTVVVDDATAREMAPLILAMQRSIWNMSTQLYPLEKAA